ANGDGQTYEALYVWCGPAAAAEPEEDEANRDENVALHHRDYEIDGDDHVRNHNQERAENQGQRRAGVREERRCTRTAKQRTCYLETLREDVAGRKCDNT